LGLKVDSKKIYGFIHIAVMGDHWEYILNDQIKNIHDSGLFDASDEIFSCVLGKTALYIPGIKTLNKNEDLSLNELFTLRSLKEFCDKQPDHQRCGWIF
jgi:hypothetical protein